jgi:hypothetical protein
MTHPDFYTDLLRRRFFPDPPLTPAERHELDLHLLICPQCNYDYAVLLAPGAPDRAANFLEQLQDELTADIAAPFLLDVARARRAGRPLSGFQSLVWELVCRDAAARLRYRQAAARLAWSSEH